MPVQWARPANLAKPVRAPEPRAERRPEARPEAPRVVLDPAQRRAEEFARARRHSQRVRLLRIGLPVAAGVAIVALIAALVISASRAPSIDLRSARIENGKLVMDNPVLNGTDERRRPYRLIAERATQDAADPTRINLQAIDAVLPVSDESEAKLTAGAGIYDATAKTLNLSEAVSVDTDDGMRIRLQDADIDIDAGTLRTINPVEVETDQAVLTAESMRVEDRGRLIVFESRVRVTLYPQKDAGAGGKPK